MNKKIAIIGCGNLGLSILQGLLNIQDLPNENIFVTKRNLDSLKEFENSGIHILKENTTAAKEADILIFALKPYNILNVISEIKDYCKNEKHYIVSCATGVSIDEIRTSLGKDIPIFRAMPNTAADVKESITCLCGINADAAKNQEVKTLFDSLGSSIFIEEKLMDAATVLGACGIAYVLRFMRAMVQGGIQIGFNAKTATEIVNQTVKGASALLIERKNHPEFEIDKVTTPKGCTIAGLNEMEHNGFSSSLIKGILKSFEEISDA